MVVIRRPGQPFVLETDGMQVHIRNFNEKEKSEFLSKFSELENDLKELLKVKDLAVETGAETSEGDLSVLKKAGHYLQKAGNLTDTLLKELLVDVQGVEFEDGESFVFEKDEEGKPTQATLDIVKIIPEIIQLNELILNVGIHGKQGYQILKSNGKVMEGVEFDPPKKKG